MCLQDLQIGRLTRAVVRRVTTVVGTVTAATPNQNRIAITFATESFGDNMVAVPELTAAGSGGIPFSGNQASTIGADTLEIPINHILHFHLSTHGDLPTRLWSITSDEAVAVMVIEYILPEGVLAMTPEELRQRSK